MTDTRPLPTVIGSTENALRALLVETLSTTAIPTYEAWVALNSAASAGVVTDAAAWRAAVADVLAKPVSVVDGAVALLERGGLVSPDGSLTDRGTAELASARGAVREATAPLLSGVAGADLQATLRVLDGVRQSAERGLRAARDARTRGASGVGATLS